MDGCSFLTLQQLNENDASLPSFLLLMHAENFSFVISCNEKNKSLEGEEEEKEGIHVMSRVSSISLFLLRVHRSGCCDKEFYYYWQYKGAKLPASFLVCVRLTSFKERNGIRVLISDICRFIFSLLTRPHSLLVDCFLVDNSLIHTHKPS